MRGSPSAVAATLARWRNLEECLLYEVRSVQGFYSAELEFDYTWGPDGLVRPDVDDVPLLVTLRLIGIEDFHLVGALTKGMREFPDQIDWGISEVAGVRVEGAGPLLKLTVAWEGKRSLTVTCMSIEVDEPELSEVTG